MFTGGTTDLGSPRDGSGNLVEGQSRRQWRCDQVDTRKARDAIGGLGNLWFHGDKRQQLQQGQRVARRVGGQWRIEARILDHHDRSVVAVTTTSVAARQQCDDGDDQHQQQPGEGDPRSAGAVLGVGFSVTHGFPHSEEETAPAPDSPAQDRPGFPRESGRTPRPHGTCRDAGEKPSRVPRWKKVLRCRSRECRRGDRVPSSRRRRAIHRTTGLL